MRFEMVKITPEMAVEMLSKNQVNRNISPSRVRQYALDMKKKRWQANGEAIKFNTKNELIDGQHRLSAIIKAGIPVTMAVLYDVEDDISIYDRGRNRSVTDTLILEGMDRAIANNRCVAIAKLGLWMSTRNNCISDSQVRDYLDEHADSLLWVMQLTTSKSGGSKSGRVGITSAAIGLSLMTAIERNYSIEKLTRWAEVVKTGFMDNASEQAAIVYRNDLISGVVKTNAREAERSKAVFQTEKSIQDFCDGKKRRMSYASWEQPVYSNY